MQREPEWVRFGRAIDFVLVRSAGITALVLGLLYLGGATRDKVIMGAFRASGAVDHGFADRAANGIFGLIYGLIFFGLFCLITFAGAHYLSRKATRINRAIAAAVTPGSEGVAYHAQLALLVVMLAASVMIASAVDGKLRSASAMTAVQAGCVEGCVTVSTAKSSYKGVLLASGDRRLAVLTGRSTFVLIAWDDVVSVSQVQPSKPRTKSAPVQR